MALLVAAAALEGRRRLEDVPERLGAAVAVGREVIQRGDELVAFVWETVGFVSLRDGLNDVRVFPALSLVGVQDLNEQRKRVIRTSAKTRSRICDKGKTK